MIFGNKQYTIQAQDKQVIFAVKVSWLFRIIWLDALILEVHSSTLLTQDAWLYKEYSLPEGLKKEDREGLQIEKWGICLGVWRLLGDHLIYKKMMATKNAISFNGNELLIKKKIVVAERFMKRQMESKAHQTNLACTLGNSSPKGLLSLKTIHMARWAHVFIIGKMCCNK